MLAIQERLKETGDSTPFGRMLREVGERALRVETLAGQIEALVGFGGRLPLHLGLASLTTWQTALYERLGPTPGALPVEDLARIPENALILGLRQYGRILLGPRALVEEHDLVLGYLPLRPDERRIVEERRRQIELIQAKVGSELDAFFAAPETALQTLVQSVAQALDRIDPVLLYVREETFTNTPLHNNLLQGRGGKDGHYLLSRLALIPSANWSWEERALLFCVHFLRQAGFRGEEFNGRQLTPYHLGKFLDQSIERFGSVIAQAERPGSEASIAAKARFLSAARAEIAKTHSFYRWVNGITLVKLQDFYPADQIQPLAAAELSPAVLACLSQFAPPRPDRSLYETFRVFLRGALDAGPESQRLPVHPVEMLLLRMVAAAVEAVPSDIGMSRCLRQLDNLIRVHDNDLAEEANGWSQAEYFCAVVPNRGLIGLMAGREKSLADILKAISARMRYNGWHYMPGHFSLERKAPDWHFYVPPAMSDTAEWSDQHHRGHIAAGVRYSIRSPGPLVLRERVYPGFYDIRLMRTEGPPYTLAELQAANRHTRTVGLFFQALLDHLTEQRNTFRFTAFGNQWFEEMRWGQFYEP